MRTILVTGGTGYLGSHLTQPLLQNGWRIVLLDINSPKAGLFNENVSFQKADLRDLKEVRLAFQRAGQIDAVIHCAGFGLAGTSNLPAFNDKTRKINFDGSRNLITACLENNVKALVFTSTVNVAFDGKEVINGNEETHKWLPKNRKHIDFYSKTKQMAEQITIQANGSLGQDGTTVLRTCVLRMGGLIGPDEKTILERSLYLMTSKIGYLSLCHKRDLLIDFTHIDNAVQGHLKATKKLLQNCPETSGEVFYLTDGNPRSLFFFLDPLYSLAHPGEVACPEAIHIPPGLTSAASYMFSGCSHILGKSYTMPFWGFTLMEAYKINVTHYFSIDKARRVLGYEPKKVTPADWQLILESFRKNPKIKLKNNNKQIISIINSKGLMQKKIHKLLSKKL